MQRHTGTHLLFFTAGLTLGTALGIVLAPAAGADTRRHLADRAQGGREFIAKTRDLFDEGRRMAEEAAEMFDEGRRLVRG